VSASLLVLNVPALFVLFLTATPLIPSAAAVAISTIGPLADAAVSRRTEVPFKDALENAVVGALAAKYSFNVAIAVLASIYVLDIVATVFLIPELKGKALE